MVAGKLEEAGAAQAAAPVAAQADAPAQATASASADPANHSQDVPAADFPMDNAVRSQAQSSGLLEAARDTGASAPRTGTGDVPATTATAATAQLPAATADGSAGPVMVTAGTASGAPAHIDQPSSAYPVRALPARDATSRPRSGSPAAAVSASAESNNEAAASPSDGPGLVENHLNASERSVQKPLPDKGGSSRIHPAAPQATCRSAHLEGHQQRQAEPAHEHQNGHQMVTADDDADSLEDGEIEDGEVLPDGIIAGAADDKYGNDAWPHINGHGHGAQQTNGHGASASNCSVTGTHDGKGHCAVNKRKRSPDYDGSQHANGCDTSNDHALSQGTPA